MQGIGFESLTIVLGCDLRKSARTPVIQPHGQQHHDKGSYAWRDLYFAEKQPLKSFVDDPNAGKEQQAGFDKSGKVLDFAVTILVLGIGRLIGNSNRQERYNGCYQVQARMSGLGENSQASRAQANDDL